MLAGSAIWRRATQQQWQRSELINIYEAAAICRETSGEEKERKKLSCDIQARQELARNVYSFEKKEKGYYLHSARAANTLSGC